MIWQIVLLGTWSINRPRFSSPTDFSRYVFVDNWTLCMFCNGRKSNFSFPNPEKTQDQTGIKGSLYINLLKNKVDVQRINTCILEGEAIF